MDNVLYGLTYGINEVSVWVDKNKNFAIYGVDYSSIGCGDIKSYKRRHRLPAWILNALNEGKGVVIDSYNVDNDYYLSIKGKVVKKRVEKEERKEVEILTSLRYPIVIENTYTDEKTYVGNVCVKNVELECKRETFEPTDEKKGFIDSLTVISKEEFKEEHRSRVFTPKFNEEKSTVEIKEFDKVLLSKYIETPVSLKDAIVFDKKIYWHAPYKDFVFSEIKETEMVNTYNKKTVLENETVSVVSVNSFSVYTKEGATSKYESEDGLRMEYDSDTDYMVSYSYTYDGEEYKGSDMVSREFYIKHVK